MPATHYPEDAQILAILQTEDLLERLRQRQAFGRLLCAALERCRKPLEAWIRDKAFFGQHVPMLVSELEIVRDDIIERAQLHLFNQLQGEEVHADCCFLPRDLEPGVGRGLLGYLKRIARRHNIVRDARTRNTVIEDEQRRTEHGRPYRVFAHHVDAGVPGAEPDDETGHSLPERVWGVDAIWNEDIEAMRRWDRLHALDDAAKLLVLLRNPPLPLRTAQDLRHFDQLVQVAGFSPRFDPRPYRRRLRHCLAKRRPNGHTGGLGMADLAAVLDVSEPTARKYLVQAQNRLQPAAPPAQAAAS